MVVGGRSSEARTISVALEVVLGPPRWAGAWRVTHDD